MEVRLIRNLRLRHQHQVLVPDLQVPDGLGEAKSLAVPYNVHYEVDPLGAGQPKSHQRRRRVELVSAMAESVSEPDMHYRP